MVSNVHLPATVEHNMHKECPAKIQHAHCSAASHIKVCLRWCTEQVDLVLLQTLHGPDIHTIRIAWLKQ